MGKIIAIAAILLGIPLLVWLLAAMTANQQVMDHEQPYNDIEDGKDQ